jgi:hypothetical protein
MKTIPNKLHCAYCIRNQTHGGECITQRSAYDETGCLIFEPDERGCIRNNDLKITVPLYHDPPLLNTWCDDWEYHGVPTSIRIKRIHGLKWDTKKGCLIVDCNCDYFVNEFHDDFKKTSQRPRLAIVK